MPRGAGKHWRSLFSGIAGCLLFVAALSVSLLAHLNLGPVRASVVQLVNRFLIAGFVGEIRLRDLKRLSLHDVELDSLDVLDASGAPVLELRQLRGDLPALSRTLKLALTGQPLNLSLGQISVARAKVYLRDDPKTGHVTIADAFELRPTSGSGARNKPRRPAQVWLPQIDVSEVDVQFEQPALKQYTARLRSIHGSVHVGEAGVAVDVQRFGVNLALDGRPNLSGTGTFNLRPDGGYAGSFQGDLAGVELQASANYQAGELEATLVSPRLSPKDAKALFESWPLVEDVEVHAHVKGPLAKAELSLSVETERSMLEGSGLLRLSDDKTSISLALDGTALDLQSFVPSAPATGLDAAADLDVILGDNTWSVTLNGSTQPSAVNDVAVPGSSFKLQASPAGSQLQVDVKEPAAAIHADISLGSAGELRARWQLPRLDLGSQRRMPDGVSGIASLSGEVTLSPAGSKLDARFDVRDFSVASVKLQRANGTLHGAAPAHARSVSDQFSALPLQLDVALKGIELAGIPFSEGALAFAGTATSLRAAGGKAELKLSDIDGRSVSLNGQLRADATLHDAELIFRRGAGSASATIAEFNPSAGTLDVPKLVVSSPHAGLAGSLRYGPQLVELALSGTDVSLPRIADLLGIQGSKVLGEADIDATITIGPDLARGQVRSQLRGLTVSHVGRGTLDVSLFLSDQTVTGSVLGHDDWIGNFSVGLGATLAGPAWSAAAYRKATGTLSVAIDEVPLENFALLSPELLTLAPEGKLGARLQLTRSGGHDVPDVSLQLGIPSFTANIPELMATRLPPHSCFARADYQDATHEVALLATVNDNSGTLVSAEAHLEAALKDVFRDAVGSGVNSTLLEAPIRAQLKLPARALSTLPVESLRAVQGSTQAQVELQGSLSKPLLAGTLAVRDLIAGTPDAKPLSIDGQFDYSAATQEARLSLDGSTLGHKAITGTLTASYAFNGAPLRTQKRDSAEFELDHLPLALIPGLSSAEIQGGVSGRLRWFSTDTSTLDAQLSLVDLIVANAPLGSGQLVLNGSDQQLAGHFSLSDGRSLLKVDLKAELPLDRLPTPSRLERLTANVSARALPAAAVSPFLTDILPRVEGKLTADFSLEHRRVSATGDTPKFSTTLDGSAGLSDGALFVEALGLELQGVTLAAIARPEDGLTKLELRDATAQARSEEKNIHAQALLTLNLPRLTQGRVVATLEDVPLAIRGQNLGHASGKLDATLTRETGWDGPAPLTGSDYLLVDVALSNARLRSAPSAARSLIDLTPNREVIVRQQRLLPLGAAPFPYRVNLHLQDDVRFAIADQELPLDGTLSIDYTDTAQLSGTIGLRPGGRLLVLNRVFEVESGSVRLNPRQAANPDINLLLRGRGADGAPITISVAGTWRDPITDPSPQELQRLLGGGTETALSSGMQALGFGALLGGAVQLRLGSGDPAETATSYSATVELGDNLWFEANYQRASSEGLGTTENSAISGTLDYRFKNNWSLRTKVGTNNGSLDLAWQYRY